MPAGTVPRRDASFRADLQAEIVRLSCEFGCAGPVIMEMAFAERLDAARLARAARLLLDAEPILGCRFVAELRHPEWRRRDDLDQAEWCTVHTDADAEEVMRRLLIPRPEHIEETFRLHLVHRPDGDTLLMWVSHMLADSYAAGECAKRLAEIYTGLKADPDYRPEPNPAPRDNEAWMRSITFRDMLQIMRRDIVDAVQCRGLVHGFQRDYLRFRETPAADAAFVRYRIPASILRAIDTAAAARRCGRNDILTTALLRAFSELAFQGPTAKAQVGLTVNLRRYAAVRDRDAICSMVGLTRVSAGPALGAGFDETLAQVTAIVERQKRDLIGAANPLFVRVMQLMSFRRKRAMVERILRRTMRRPMAPTFSNAGRMSPAWFRFDGAAPVDVGFVVYPVALPLFLVGALEYAGTLTLTVCFQPADLAKERVYRFLERMVEECPREEAAAVAEAAG